TLSRDPEQKRDWVVVVDGEINQLGYIHKTLAATKASATVIVDFIHVLEYLWKAAYSFHAVSSQEAEQWVTERALKILQGKSTEVAAGMRRSATLKNLSQEKRKAVDKCAGYLRNNKPYLKYDEYLAAGYPIASGVIEGACRHLINDRLGITGSRWGLKTAEAILKLRSLRSSGDFEDYWKFHKKQERERNHAAKYKTPELLAA
ncbi:MAG: ISKra4 family transposase, partial [Exilibacterium sp.]